MRGIGASVVVTSKIEDFLERGPLHHRRARFADQRQRARREILGILSEPGCAFCRRERTRLKRFLFWYREALLAADIVVPCIEAALDLLLNPERLVATLRR